jgi:hypothetical protein
MAGFGNSLFEGRWGDMMMDESDLGDSVGQLPTAAGRSAATKFGGTEYDELAENSGAGINALFKKVRSVPRCCCSYSYGLPLFTLVHATMVQRLLLCRL